MRSCVFPHPLSATALALVALLASPARSEEATLQLTLPQALTWAKNHSPQLLAARAQVQEAQGGVTSAFLFLASNPTLQSSLGPRRSPTASNGIDLDLKLSQPVELGGKRSARRDSASAHLAAEEARLLNAERLVLGDTAAAYLQALYARQRLALAQDTLKMTEELARSAKHRFEAGEVPVVEAHVGRVALARAQASVLKIEGQRLRAWAELKQHLGLPLTTPLALQGDLETLALEGQVLPPSETRPDLTALEADLSQARAGLRQAQAQRWPDLTLGVGYEREGQEEAAVGTLSLPLPFFDRGQGEQQVEAARIQKITSTLEATRRSRAVATEAARAIHQQHFEATRVLREQALPFVEENLTLSGKSYAAGEMGLAELLVIRREALDARAEYLDQVLATGLAHIQLLVQNGAFP